MNLRELLAKLEQVKSKGIALIDKASAENRNLTEVEEKDLADIEASVQDLQEKISNARNLEQRHSALNSINVPGSSTPSGTNEIIGGVPANDIRVGVERTTLDPTSGFANLSEFASCVFSANPHNPQQNIDARLNSIQANPSNFHRENASNEGYIVPPEFSNEIWEVANQEPSLYSMIDLEPTNSNHVNDLSDESTPWGEGGVKAHWGTEAGQMQRSKDDTKKQRTITLNKLYAFVEASDELLEDAPRLQSRLTRKAGKAINWKRDEAIIYGDGSGKPLGYFNSNALISVPQETGQTEDTILAANIAKMYSRIFPSSLSRAIWLTNQDCIDQLMFLEYKNNMLWTPPNEGFKNAPGGFILGRPVRFSEHAKTLGDKGDIQLIDPKGYYGLVKNGGVKFDKSIHLWFDYGLMAFRWTTRMGGQPHLSEPVAPNNGSNTKSHFVTLDERAGS